MRVRVRADPYPQGSHVSLWDEKAGKIRTIASGRDKLDAWREAVCVAAKGAWSGPRLEGPVEMSVRFYLRRPRTVTRAWPHVPPDLDKLMRSTKDGLTMAHKVWGDDGQVCRYDLVEKVYATATEPPGALIVITALADAN